MKKLLQFLFKKRLFTLNEVHNVINNTRSAAIQGTIDYIQSPHVFIKQKSSGKRIKNSELVSDNDKNALNWFVNQRLIEIGIQMKGEND